MGLIVMEKKKFIPKPENVRKLQALLRKEKNGSIEPNKKK
jgi:hypothetical protein